MEGSLDERGMHKSDGEPDGRRALSFLVVCHHVENALSLEKTGRLRTDSPFPYA